MKRELAQAVKKEFAVELKQKLPQFAPLKTKNLPNGWFAFVWEVRPDFFVYIVLVISRDDRFTIELAWSSNGEFPATATLSNPIAYPEFNVRRDEPRDGEFRFRLARLWLPRGDFWWELIPPPSLSELNDRVLNLGEGGAVPDDAIDGALEKVGPSVRECIDKIITCGLRFIHRPDECLARRYSPLDSPDGGTQRE